MAGSERGETGQHREAESPPYYRAATFIGRIPAGLAYFRAQEAIVGAPVDLSTFRFQLNRIWHVAILGEPPPEPLDRTLRQILAAGEATTLPPDILRALQERQAQADKIAPS